MLPWQRAADFKGVSACSFCSVSGAGICPSGWPTEIWSTSVNPRLLGICFPAGKTPVWGDVECSCNIVKLIEILFCVPTVSVPAIPGVQTLHSQVREKQVRLRGNIAVYRSYFGVSLFPPLFFKYKYLNTAVSTLAYNNFSLLLQIAGRTYTPLFFHEDKPWKIPLERRRWRRSRINTQGS